MSLNYIYTCESCGGYYISQWRAERDESKKLCAKCKEAFQIAQDDDGN